jgi:hypothetical protein
MRRSLNARRSRPATALFWSVARRTCDEIRPQSSQGDKRPHLLDRRVRSVLKTESRGRRPVMRSVLRHGNNPCPCLLLRIVINSFAWKVKSMAKLLYGMIISLDGGGKRF